MGTRGFMGVRRNGTTRYTYNHFDSYPTGLGTDMAELITKRTDQQLVALANRIMALPMVDETDEPSPEQMEKLKEDGFYEGVSTGQDWYAALRGAQGQLERYPDAGYWPKLGYDPLLEEGAWLEWGYVLDVDKRELEIYDLPGGKSTVKMYRLTFDTIRQHPSAHRLMESLERETEDA